MCCSIIRRHSGSHLVSCVQSCARPIFDGMRKGGVVEMEATGNRIQGAGEEVIYPSLASAQDATSAPLFVPAYQPPSRALNADNVPAAGIAGQVTASQIQTIDGSQVTGTVAKALQSDQATTAATAMSIDPNATLPNQQIGRAHV